MTGSGGRPRALVGACMAAALVLGGCTGDGGGTNADATGTDATEAITPEPTSPATIAQPDVSGDLPLAPESQRVDITMPTFSDPTKITNPLFPV
ncbi:MAG: hypothetical protein H0W97_04130, partial [Actinobacteria bacterium]|nr:hypothetical protein [Actinomycetota bacterium]